MKEELRKHERFGHFYVPSIKVQCPACSIAKAKGLAHAKKRPEHLIPKEFLDQVDWDFKGPLPESFTGKRRILSAVD